MGFSMHESAAGDAQLCGQSKCARDARAFQLERLVICLLPRERSARAYREIVETKTAEGNVFAAWKRCEQAQTDSTLRFHVSAQSLPERIVSDR